jgi:hypothetical protein
MPPPRWAETELRLTMLPDFRSRMAGITAWLM